MLASSNSEKNNRDQRTDNTHPLRRVKRSFKMIQASITVEPGNNELTLPKYRADLFVRREHRKISADSRMPFRIITGHAAWTVMNGLRRTIMNKAIASNPAQR